MRGIFFPAPGGGFEISPSSAPRASVTSARVMSRLVDSLLDLVEALQERNLATLISASFISGVFSSKFVQFLRKKTNRRNHGNLGSTTRSKSGGAATITSGASPHPSWQPGGDRPQSCPYGADATTVSLTPAEVPGGTYALFVSTVVPRPIALTSTISADGFVNLAPFSYFGGVSHDPPVVAIGICRSSMRGGARKDTLANIEATGTFVVSIMSDWYVESANHTCGNFDPHVDEFELAGLTKVWDCRHAAAPRVGEAAISMECKVKHLHELNSAVNGKPSCTVVLGEVVMFHFHPAVYGVNEGGKGVVDVAKLRPISRLGGNTYATLGGTFDVPRPDRKV